MRTASRALTPPLLIACCLLGCRAPEGDGPRDAGDGDGDGDVAADAGTDERDAGAPGDGGVEAHQDVHIATADGVTLAATIWRDPAVAGSKPGVLLLHQFTNDRGQWGAFTDELVAAGHVVLAIDLRGHGDSDAYDQALSNLLTDPDGAPHDVRASMAFLKALPDVDAARTAVIGTSIGANLTVMASIEGLATTYVALSTRVPPVEALAGTTATGMRSVLYISSANDGGGQAADSQTMRDATASPTDYLEVAGSDHGIALLAGHEEVRSAIFSWLADNL